MIYRLPQFKTEIENPTLKVSKTVNELNPEKMTLTANITLETKESKLYGINLEGVKVEDLNYNYDQLVERVKTKLEEYKTN